MAIFKYDLGDEKDQKIPTYIAAFLIVLLGALFAVVWAIDATLPSALTIQDEGQKTDRFIAGRAQDLLKGLTDIGARVVGSIENEVLAVEYLKNRIEEILYECENPGADTYYQIQSGAFYLDYRPFGSINAYSNLQNIVVRLPGDEDTKESILINAHFDTMPNSPGGSDDGIMCAVMLEVLRHMCNERSKSNLIFLFNGAEESYLQGSHAFIANENKWGDRIKLVINLEATGTGGKEMLFQAGPQQYWLLEHYSKVPHPHAQVAGEEIFESNLIPSDTDFRNFRDFGNTIGYDMAYTRNGYRYHSENDGFENIDVGTFQHTGDNVLALVKALSKVNVIGKQDPSRKPVFYDMFGLFLVYYEEKVEIAVNIVAILLSFASAILGLYRAQLKFSAKSVKCLIINLLGTIVGLLLALAFVLAIGAILDAVNKTMSWYRFPFFIAGLYVIPVFLSLSLTTMLLLKYNNYENMNGDVFIIIHINRFIWTVILLAGTALSIRSSYVLIYPIYFTSIALIIINIFKLEVYRKTWQIVYVISTVIPTLFSMYIALEVYGLFVPICGRSGSEWNPEFIIGLFTWIIASFILSFYVPIVCMARYLKYLLMVLLGTCIIFIIVACSAFIPYDENSSTPVLQRYWMFHSSRTIRDDNNNVIKKDNGFSFYNMDRNSPMILDDYIGDYLVKAESLADDCRDILYCGLPVLFTESIENLEKYIWIPTETEPMIDDKVELMLTSVEYYNSGKEIFMKYCFKTFGTDHYNIYFSPRKNIMLKKIDLLERVPTNQPKWNGRETYFILYVDGKDRKALEFCINLESISGEFERVNLDIAVVGTYYNEKVMQKSEEYKDFLSKFPKWTSLNAWTGSYESWVY